MGFPSSYLSIYTLIALSQGFTLPAENGSEPAGSRMRGRQLETVECLENNATDLFSGLRLITLVYSVQF